MGLSQSFARAREIVPSAGQRPSASTDGNRHVIIALCVEQGFAGVFSERVLDHAQSAAAAVAEHGHGSELVIVGDRGVMVAQLCEALILSLAAENEARTRAMIPAKTNVTKTLDRLVSRARQLRQEEITNEIIELASSASTPR